jgi:hypothetical protein
MWVRAGFAVLVMLSSALASTPESKSDSKREERTRALVMDVCTTCHEFTRVKAQALSKEEWTGVIKGMISEGSPVTDEEMGLIVDYLARHFGPKSAQRGTRSPGLEK